GKVEEEARVFGEVVCLLELGERPLVVAVVEEHLAGGESLAGGALERVGEGNCGGRGGGAGHRGRARSPARPRRGCGGEPRDCRGDQSESGGARQAPRAYHGAPLVAGAALHPVLLFAVAVLAPLRAAIV